MKKSIYFIAIALMFSLTSFAQQANDNQQGKSIEPPTAEQIAKRQADRMKQQYLLGNDQYDKVYKLCLKRAEQQVARMQEMKKEQEQMNTEMKKILNETQYERYENQQNRPHQMMRRGMQRGRFQQQGACPMHQGNMMRQGNMRLNPNQMQMPAKQLQKGQAIDKQTQMQGRRRPAMYDDTRKLNEANAQNSTENNTQKELK